MFRALRRLLVFLVCLAVPLAGLTACGGSGGGQTAAYDTSADLPAAASGVIAENNLLQLLWDSSRSCVLLYDKATSKVWSSIPYEFYKTDGAYSAGAEMMNSPIQLEFVDNGSQQVRTSNASVGALEKGRVASKRVKDGLEVTYYFDELKISVPLRYTLRNDSLQVTLLADRIVEGDNKVYRVDILPFFASATNNGDNAWLFVPSGSGALLYTDDMTLAKRTYSEEVYGEDPSVGLKRDTRSTNQARLAVFGVHEGSDALCCIVEDGAESASVLAQAGSDGFGYSSVWAAFRLRGVDSLYVNTAVGNTVSVSKFSDARTKTQSFSVGYYPLGGDDASLAGMAKLYGKYLVSKYGMKTSCTNPALGIELLGGAQTRGFVLGIPRVAVTAATTFAQAQSIVEDIRSATGLTPAVRLSGYGLSGMDVGKVAGGYKLSGQLGGLGGYRTLRDYCEKTGVKTYMEYNLISFNKSGDGFSSWFTTAKTADDLTAWQYRYSLALYDIDSSLPRYMLLARGKLIEAAEKLIDRTLAQGISGIALGDASSVAYSDYTDAAYYAKAGIADDVAAILSAMRANGETTAVSDANAYAAASADQIFDAPTASSGYDSLDADVPFYEMVFKGYVPLTVSAINLSNDPRLQFLKAMQTGCGLGFSLISQYRTEFTDTIHSELSGSVYGGNRGALVDMAAQSREYLAAVASAKIDGYRILADGVTETIFSNGVRTVVNFTEQPFDDGGQTVGARGFVWKQ